ncbi:hypothetical protein PRCB_11580 [Pantoea rodasii]|uniref:Uncharacterized protein n=1 Tax=Pantoea rodasii TaxID=1076549 RepID=A0A2M9WCR7_9GAMM|nr:hypothetical protein PRCB_11580 [Pantoea rodasii]
MVIISSYHPLTLAPTKSQRGYTRHTSCRSGVGFACSPQSLTLVSSEGFTRLPPCYNPNYLGY